MNHLKSISQHQPAKGAQWQEIICTVAVAFNSVLGFFGGSSPLGEYLEDKCDIPQPNTGDDTEAS